MRCSLVTGSVLEGDEEPVCVGRFKMSLAMPATEEADLQQLEVRYSP